MHSLTVPFLRLVQLFAPKPKTVCAHCMKERGEKPRIEDSHGICKRHYREMMAEVEAMKREKGGK